MHKQKSYGPKFDAYVRTGTVRENTHDQERERKTSWATFKKKGRGKKDKERSHM